MEHEREKLLRKRNVISVLNVLNQRQNVSRADLARETALTPATVSSIISRLEKLDIIKMLGPGASKGGRRPVILRFNPDAFYLLGIDVGLEKTIIVITDLHGNIIVQRRLESTASFGAAAILDKIATLCTSIIADNEAVGHKIRGIGISYPGLVDSEQGIGLIAPNWPELNDFRLPAYLSSRLGLEASIENDAAVMTLGQARFGAARGYRNVLGIILGLGIGGGIIINGELYRGISSTAGQFGHITVNPLGPTCGCGNQGCLETVASGMAIAATAQRLVQSGRNTAILAEAGNNRLRITAKHVADAARNGDDLAIEIMTQAADYIGIALADAMNLIDPELIIIGGGLSQAGDYFIGQLQRIVKRRAYAFGIVRSPHFVLADFGEEANAIGAASLVLEKFLDVNARDKE
jgi:glucokinase-like ROK family protein